MDRDGTLRFEAFTRIEHDVLNHRSTSIVYCTRLSTPISLMLYYKQAVANVRLNQEAHAACELSRDERSSSSSPILLAIVVSFGSFAANG